MAKYIVRLWIDVVIEANSKEEAKLITADHNKVPVDVGTDIEVYDIQVGDAWERNKE